MPPELPQGLIRLFTTTSRLFSPSSTAASWSRFEASIRDEIVSILNVLFSTAFISDIFALVFAPVFSRSSLLKLEEFSGPWNSTPAGNTLGFVSAPAKEQKPSTNVGPAGCLSRTCIQRLSICSDEANCLPEH